MEDITGLVTVEWLLLAERAWMVGEKLNIAGAGGSYLEVDAFPYTLPPSGVAWATRLHISRWGGRRQLNVHWELDVVDTAGDSLYLNEPGILWDDMEIISAATPDFFTDTLHAYGCVLPPLPFARGGEYDVVLRYNNAEMVRIRFTIVLKATADAHDAASPSPP